ncbi:VanZ family protein [Paenibacillus sp. OAS669]|uniref:VanZ family protein n=1 Tax=Paenibacillus sp. OAS669 TaxID=2663821 RepID=UPI0019E8F340|nr:VanZ family protein [Paenibacillus sp. OAS669]MBE1446125.1 glycopeptide antibiotics resistance protein [Paenibacillus sp. OAS669]
MSSLHLTGYSEAKVLIPLSQVRQWKLHVWAAWLLFFSYSLLMIYLLFFGFSRSARTERLYNLVPFKTIGSYITDFQYYPLDLWIINVFGNVGAFVPFGFLIPMLFRSYDSWFSIAKLMFWSLLIVESIQFLFKVGSFDVDDIILNVLGGLWGYAIYTATISRSRRRKLQKSW